MQYVCGHFSWKFWAFFGPAPGNKIEEQIKEATSWWKKEKKKETRLNWYADSFWMATVRDPLRLLIFLVFLLQVNWQTPTLSYPHPTGGFLEIHFLNLAQSSSGKGTMFSLNPKEQLHQLKYNSTETYQTNTRPKSAIAFLLFHLPLTKATACVLQIGRKDPLCVAHSDRRTRVYIVKAYPQAHTHVGTVTLKTHLQSHTHPIQ